MGKTVEKLEVYELPEKAPALIERRGNFEVWTDSLEQLMETVAYLEAAVESQRLTCRVYTKGRIAAAGMGIFSLGTGIAALAGIAAHNFLTYNPDYEICRDVVNKKVLVEFKK